MPIEVPANHAAAVALFEGFPFDRPTLAARASRSPRLFVDDPVSPSAAVLLPTVDPIGFAAGHAPAAALVDLLAHALDECPDRGMFTSVRDEMVAEAAAERFGHRFARVDRVDFEHPGGAVIDAPALADGYALASIDAALCRRIGEGLDPNFARLWPDPAAFARDGLGFCVTHGGGPVAYAASCAPVARWCEFIVATAAAHRRRGLCTAAGRALLAACAARGLAPAWGAHAANHRSRAAARRLGFARERPHVWLQHTPCHAGRTSVPPAAAELAAVVGSYRGTTGYELMFGEVDGRLVLHEAGVPAVLTPRGAGGGYFFATMHIRLQFAPPDAGGRASHVTLFYADGTARQFDRV